MNGTSCQLYKFYELSETAKQNALKMIEQPFMKAGEEIWETEALRGDIDNVWFYRDGTIA